MTPTLAFETWLKIATHDIGRIGTARIQSEITAHYDEAYSAALAKEHSEDVASAMALKSLGNAVEAGKRYAVNYLTKKEELLWGMNIREVYESDHRWTWLLCIIPGIIALLVTILNREFSILGYGTLSIAYGFNTLWKHHYVAQCKLRRAFIFSHTMGLIFMWIVCLTVVYSPHEFMDYFGSFALPVCAVLTVLTGHLIHKQLRMARKLPKQLSQDDLYTLQSTPRR